MSNIKAGLLAVVFSTNFGSDLYELPASGKIVDERYVRAASAGHYSELLRLACANGWKFRRGDVVAGFKRHYEEMRLVLIDKGATIVPLGYVPELKLIESFAGPTSRDRDRRRCFEGRWQVPRPPALSAVRPIAD